MRTLNNKLIGLLLITSLSGTGCTDDEVLLEPGTVAGGGTITNIFNSGTVSAKNFNLTADDLAPAVYNATTNTIDQSVSVTLTASIGDRFNQILTDQHTIYFKTEYGLIQPYCITLDGSCSVTWIPSGNLPANDTGGTNIGSPAATIVAYTYGEEEFTDLNSDGIYDDLDGNFVDLEEPYIDIGNNGIYDLGTDISIKTVNGNDPYGTNDVHDIGDTLFNGPSCTHSTNCGTVKYVAVWDSLVLKLDGGTLAQFTLGGTVTGLAGSVTLSNGTEDLIVSANGSFTFVTPIDNSSSYSVLIASQPVGQTCTVTNGTGTVANGDVTNIAVDCVNNYSVGGNITGLVGSVTLQNNAGDDLVVTSPATNFTFTTGVADGSAYNVTVSAQPAGQTCTVTGGGSGTIASADITTVAVSCVSTAYTVGGTVTGLTGTLTLLENINAETLPVTTGSFTFTTPFYTTDAYNVTISGQPVGQSCSITGTSGAGTVVDINITTIDINCVDVSYNIGGAISNLDGDILLLNNGADATIISSTTPSTVLFNMTTKMVTGDTYAITVSSSPLGQLCQVTSGGTGTVGTSNVTSVVINCSDQPYNINASVTGLTGGTLTLLNNANAGDPLNFTADGTQTFGTQVVNNASYDVTVSAQPAGQTCTVSNGTGTVSAANVTVNVNCVANTISGTITGTAFPSGSLDVVLNAGTETINKTANGAFAFATTLDNGANYAVTVANNTTTLACTVAGGTNNDGTGTVTGPVTGITITCN